MNALHYRVSEEGDLPGLLRLWEEAGWGILTAEQWREWFVEGPEGACLITVAVDASGEIVGQEIFAPSRVSVAGREVRAVRFSAPILRKELRGASLRRDEHPLVGLFQVAAGAAREQGIEIVYSLPEHAWLPIFRRGSRLGFTFEAAEFGCAQLALEAVPSATMEASPVARFGPEYEELWRSARETFPIACGVVRDSAWLTFRNSGRIALEIRDAGDGSLVGYSATKRQTGLLADALARRPEDLGAVIAATAFWLAEQRRLGEFPDLTHLKAMRTPALDPAVRELGFEPVDYRFAFTCNTLGGSERVTPQSWYVMPGD